MNPKAKMAMTAMTIALGAAPRIRSRKERLETAQQMIDMVKNSKIDLTHPAAAEYIDTIVTMQLIVVAEQNKKNRFINRFIRDYCKKKAKEVTHPGTVMMLRRIAQHQICIVELDKAVRSVETLKAMAASVKEA